MIERITREIKNLKFIEKTLKAGWLERLNANLTLTKGKCKPWEVITQNDFSTCMNKLDSKSRASQDFKKKVAEDPGFLATWYSESMQLWMWSLNKVVLQIPAEVIDDLHETFDLAKIPSKPLFNLPQWSTMVKLEGDANPEDFKLDEDGFGFIQHYLLFNNITLNDKDYLFIRMFMTRAGRNDKGETTYLPSTFFTYIAKDSDNVIEGIRKAKEELAVVIKSHLTEQACYEFTDVSETIQDIMNVLFFITGEHDKKIKAASKNPESKGSSQYKALAGYKIHVRPKEVMATVGDEYVELHKQYGESVKRHGLRKSHFRKGHFHTYWLGPRNEPQTPVVHWIPPMMVKGRTADE